MSVVRGVVKFTLEDVDAPLMTQARALVDLPDQRKVQLEAAE